jgi:hypothetical protein
MRSRSFSCKRSVRDPAGRVRFLIGLRSRVHFIDRADEFLERNPKPIGLVDQNVVSGPGNFDEAARGKPRDELLGRFIRQQGALVTSNQ